MNALTAQLGAMPEAWHDIQIRTLPHRHGISPHTVQAFLRLVMSKMQVSTRSGILGRIFDISS